jgi:hypothetical protein
VFHRVGSCLNGKSKAAREEQTSELALLRVVAMTRAQVRHLVLSQAAIIGLIGLGWAASTASSSLRHQPPHEPQ